MICTDDFTVGLVAVFNVVVAFIVVVVFWVVTAFGDVVVLRDVTAFGVVAAFGIFVVSGAADPEGLLQRSPSQHLRSQFLIPIIGILANAVCNGSHT